jgi:hypothetical protein
LILTLQNVEADSAELVDVGMVNFRDEADFWGAHGVILGQKELQFEDAALERGSLGT